MKTSAMITMAAMMAGCAWAATKPDSQRLVICIEDGKHAGVADAASKASSLFLSAGVKLEWHDEGSFCQGNVTRWWLALWRALPKCFIPAL